MTQAVVMNPDGTFTLNTGAKMPAVGLATWLIEDSPSSTSASTINTGSGGSSSDSKGDGSTGSRSSSSSSSGGSGGCKAAVLSALQKGYRAVDCAHLYGNELEVGDALHDAFESGVVSREQCFITSKFWCTTAGAAKNRVGEACERALKNLRLDYLDLFLLHWAVDSSTLTTSSTSGARLGDATDPPRPAEGVALLPLKHKAPPLAATGELLRAAWHAMEGLVERGLVRAIGISNFSSPVLIEELLAGAKIVPAVNQVELHPLWRQDALLEFCASKGIHVSAHTPLGIPARFSSLGAGEDFLAASSSSPTTPTGAAAVAALAAVAAAESSANASATVMSPRTAERAVTTAKQKALLRSWSKSVPPGKGKSGSVLAPMLRHPVVQEVAAKYGRTPAQVILRWHLQRGTSVLPMSMRPEHIASNLDVVDWVLEPEDWQRINTFADSQIALIDDRHSYLCSRSRLGELVEEEGEGVDGEGDAQGSGEGRR